MRRRDFLKATAAAAPMIVSAKALAQANDPAVRAAVDRLVWRLENLRPGSNPRTGRADS